MVEVGTVSIHHSLRNLKTVPTPNFFETSLRHIFPIELSKTPTLHSYGRVGTVLKVLAIFAMDMVRMMLKLLTKTEDPHPKLLPKIRNHPTTFSHYTEKLSPNMLVRLVVTIRLLCCVKYESCSLSFATISTVDGNF